MKPREEQILRALANDVRVLSLTQIARTWWTDTRWGRSRSRQAMERLQSEGWAQLHSSIARPINELSGPILSWSPGEASPNFRLVSRTLHRRAVQAGTMTSFVFASAQCIVLFGQGRAPSVKLTQMTHDLQVSEVYLTYRRNGMSAECWLSEDRLPRDWELKSRPDALLTDRDGTILRAIEYGGDYPPVRLKNLHDAFASIELKYEIW